MSHRNTKPRPDSNRVETITPRIAANLMKNAAENRSIRPDIVDQYAADMKAGRWRLNGETIKLNRSGGVIDGQHRLLACIKSGYSFKTYVARGLVEDEVIHSIDVGISRTPSDFLRFHGFTDSKSLAATARVFHEISDAQPVKSPGYGLRADATLKSRAVLLDYLTQHRSIQDSVAFLGGHRADIAGWVPLSLVAGTHAFCSVIANKGLATDFIGPLCDGASLTKASAIHRLRQRLQKEALKIGLRISAKAKLCLILRSWNRWVTNTPVARMPLMTSTTAILIPKVLKPGENIGLGSHSRRAMTRDDITKKKKRQK